jgi:hypothetical protein
MPRENVLYIEVAPGANIETNIQPDGWMNIKIKGEVVHVNDTPPPQTIIQTELFNHITESDLESQSDSFITDPEDEGNRNHGTT